jgi:dienelactone hydrolase
MEIRETQRLDNGILERHFTVAGMNGPVPGIVWTPAATAGPVPLILVGHGGGGTKMSPTQVLPLRDYFTAALGIAAVASIDAPQHGDRGPIRNIREPAWAELWKEPEQVIDEMTRDWCATLDALLALGEFDDRAVAYSGMSLGAIFGIPFVAAEPRIAVAVLGLTGLRSNAGLSAPESIARRSARLAADAPRIKCPLIFHVQWDDELVVLDSAFELYGLFGSSDKRLQSTPGLHGMPRGEARDTVRTFLEGRLAALNARAIAPK